MNWDGDNASGNFNFANNWYGNTVPSLPSNFSAGNLVFNFRNNASQLNQFYDWASWASINDIIWETTWAVPTTFNGNGNGLNFNQRLENRSSQTVTIGTMNLSGGKNGATQIELNPVNGDLTLNGNIYNDNNLRYKVYGANSKMLTVNTALSGNSSVALDIEQYSKVKFTAAQTMGSAAAYNVKQGEFWLDTGGSLASGSTVNLGQADANVAKFYLAPSAGGMTHAGNITVANSGGIKVLGSLASTGTNTFSGNVALNGTAQLENVSSGGTANFSGSLSGSGGVNVGATNANGRVVLSGSNSYTGATLVQQGGTLVVSHANALGATNGGTTVQSGATLGFSNNVNVAENVTIVGTGVTNSGALRNAAGNNTLTGQLSLSGNATVQSDAGLLTLSGAIAGTTTNAKTMTVDGAGNVNLNGSLVSTVTSLVKNGSGTATLNGTVAATSIQVSSGLLALGAADRITNSAAVSVSVTGALNLNGDNTVASVGTTGGTVGGTGTLTAATYDLNGGTVNANLGTGTITSSSGTTILNGTAAATTVTVNGGTLNTGSANRLADNVSLAVTAGNLGIGGNDTVGSVAVSSSGTVNLASGATLTATADSSISGTGKATGGTVAVSNGAKLTLANNATTTSSDISVGATSSLVGTGGTTGKISGSGLLGPGNSPGILTAGQVDLSGGLDFTFEFTGTGAPTYSNAGGSRNDLLHLTAGNSPFVGTFSSANSISFFFNDAALGGNLLASNPATYLGGFYVDSVNFDIASLLASATKSYYVVDANGSFVYNSVSYSLLSPDAADRVIFGNTNQTNSSFDTGTTSGTVLSVTMVPEPSTTSLLGLTLTGAMTL
ncbi:MAG: hypothetical protein EBT50_07590, partial [Verrucomicrobia bacterium]|nr:hypothetical protein [Verrucomicrobiota bacterium]